MYIASVKESILVRIHDKVKILPTPYGISNGRYYEFVDDTEGEVIRTLHDIVEDTYYIVIRTIPHNKIYYMRFPDCILRRVHFVDKVYYANYQGPTGSFDDGWRWFSYRPDHEYEDVELNLNYSRTPSVEEILDGIWEDRTIIPDFLKEREFALICHSDVVYGNELGEGYVVRTLLDRTMNQKIIAIRLFKTMEIVFLKYPDSINRIISLGEKYDVSTVIGGSTASDLCSLTIPYNANHEYEHIDIYWYLSEKYLEKRRLAEKMWPWGDDDAEIIYAWNGEKCTDNEMGLAAMTEDDFQQAIRNSSNKSRLIERRELIRRKFKSFVETLEFNNRVAEEDLFSHYAENDTYESYDEHERKIDIIPEEDDPYGYFLLYGVDSDDEYVPD